MSTRRDIDEEKLEWERTSLQRAQKRVPERDIKTWSGLPVERLYTPEKDDPSRYLERLGFPGEYPFTRGVHPTGYRGKLWTRRPITGFSSAEETNGRVHHLLQSGQTGLHFVFDYPTLTGYDSDHPFAEGEVGVSGIPVDSLADIRVLFQGINLREISISYSHWGPYILSFLLAHADEQGIPRADLHGTTQNDVLMYYHSCPWWDLPLDGNLKLFSDVVEFCLAEMPGWNPVSISGYNIRDGGCSAVQEIAFTLGDACAYLDACLERGLSVDQVARRFSFMVCAHIDFFEEVAKMRAMRRMWARIVRDQYGCADPRAQMLRFHAQTSGASLTAQQPLNNIVRGTVEALVAVLGGAQSLHISCFDETYGLPTEESAKVSVNTQNILAYETGVAGSVDPLGGSYLVESLTDRLEHEAWSLLEEIRRRGGMVAAARSGWVREQKLAWARRYQEDVDSGRRVVVGVNAFQSEESGDIAYTRPDPEAQEQQIKRTRAVKASRDVERAAKALDALRKAAARGGNVMPYTIDAARNLVTLGEMYETMRSVYGEIPGEEFRYA